MLNKLRSSGGRRSNKYKGQKNGLQLNLTPTGKYRFLTMFAISFFFWLLQYCHKSFVKVNISVNVIKIEFQKSTSDGLNREEINKIGTAAAELGLSSFLAGIVDRSALVLSTAQLESPAYFSGGERDYFYSDYQV